MQEELIQNLKSGSEDAFKTLFESYSKMVTAVSMNFLRNEEDARDTAQEVFVEIFRSIKNFREKSNLSTWIYRIAVTKSLDLLRKQKRIKRFGIVKRILHTDESGEQVILTSSDNPGSELDSSERAGILKSALDTLPENQRIALTLSKIEGFSNPEIAEIMKTSISAVESLIHRGSKNLKNSLEKTFRRLQLTTLEFKKDSV